MTAATSSKLIFPFVRLDKAVTFRPAQDNQMTPASEHWPAAVGLENGDKFSAHLSDQRQSLNEFEF